VREPSLNSLSIVIPTYNRAEVLARALDGYLSQSSPALIHELLVVDDGSTDGTASAVRDFSERSDFPIRYLHQSNKGPAAARNFGIREAAADLVLFTDSDIVPARDLVEQHIAWHRKNPEITSAVLGYVTWPAEIGPTPFMRWYGEHQMFAFRRMRKMREASFHFFYTCNVSLKVEFLRACGQFDEDFKTAAYEDIELGFRLSKKGMKLLYNSAAIGYHHQFFSFEDACRKARNNAGATRLFFPKEAGRQLMKELEQRQSRPGFAFSQWLAREMARILRPLRRFLDSSVPLPRILYHLFFWASTRAADRQGVLAASGAEAKQKVSSQL
jgi:glycosyltransferase involved in cell wall biosynthesis